MKKFLRLCAAFAMFVTAAATLPACNTTEGAGRDIESVGDKIEDAAD